ncbi:MAG: hypothetical protein AAFQ80_16000 [Cyanobacteria bacterium J06621_8]
MKQSVLQQKKYLLLLYSLGCIQGALSGYFFLRTLDDFSLYLHNIFMSSKIWSILPYNFILGFLFGLLIQGISVYFIWILMSYKSNLYEPITWLCIGLSLGIFAVTSDVGGLIFSSGFILTYALIIIIPHVLVFFTGTEAMAFLVFDAAKLIILYLISLLLNYLFNLACHTEVIAEFYFN